MSPLGLVLLGAGAIAAAGVLALFFVRAPRLATNIAAAGAVVGGAVGLWGALLALAGGFTGELAIAWQVPGGRLVVGVDPLTAYFAVPLFVLGPLCAIYGRRYLDARPGPAVALNLLLAAMALVLVARNALLFLVAWEGMTLLAYLLVTIEHGEAEVRRAGWVYLIASHVAVVALFALFVGLGARAGGALELASFAAAWREPAAAGAGIFVLALVGFGIKAGVIGAHVWLPEAHGAAPSHVSALMSGVLIKLGLYGILRTTLLVSPGAWFGVALMILGVTGAVLGIALAVHQRDLKRALAYSSIENVGIILLALGLGFWARAHGDGRLAAIAFGAGLLHVWNHAAMKGLLFLAAGSVLHGAGTKDIERLGGLLRRMPWTGRAFVAGAVAIAALPPLNGFASEWLLFQGLARVGLGSSSAAGLAAIAGAAALALAGGLAALCFVRLTGTVFLGAPRSDAAARAHESPPAMTVPLVILAAVCFAGALAAPALVSTQSALLAQLGAASALDVAAAASLLHPVALINGVLLAAIGLVIALLVRRAARAERTETWGCGYAAPTARMQYTGRAFSEILSSRVLPRWLRGRVAIEPPAGPFPASASFASDTTDPLMRDAYEPLLARWGQRFARLRFLQQGNVHVYILYIVLTAVVALAWLAARDWILP